MNNKTTPKQNLSKDRFSSLREDKKNPFLQQTKKYEKKNDRWGDLKSEPEEYNDRRFNNNHIFINDSRFSNQDKRNNFKKPDYHRRPFFIPSNKNGIKKEPEKKDFTFNNSDFPDLPGNQ